MSDKISYQKIRQALRRATPPGWVAQKKMAPPYRQTLVDKGKYNPNQPKIAAVLILIFIKDNQLYFPLIHRNTYPGPHSNQIGFPGGKIEETDDNLQQTAVRETYEEIHALPDKIEVLGKLTQLFIPPSNFIVHPFIGLYNAPPLFVPDEHEVKNIIHVNLLNFLQNPPTTTHSVHTEMGQFQVPAFNIDNNQIVWGASAMILNEFLSLLQDTLEL